MWQVYYVKNLKSTFYFKGWIYYSLHADKVDDLMKNPFGCFHFGSLLVVQSQETLCLSSRIKLKQKRLFFLDQSDIWLWTISYAAAAIVWTEKMMFSERNLLKPATILSDNNSYVALTTKCIRISFKMSGFFIKLYFENKINILVIVITSCDLINNQIIFFISFYNYYLSWVQLLDGQFIFMNQWTFSHE